MKDTTVRLAGVDWASAQHAVCVVDGAGAVVDRFVIVHRAGELVAMCRRLGRLGVGRVGIERPDGPVVDALMGAGLEVVVIASRQVKALRERYGSALVRAREDLVAHRVALGNQLRAHLQVVFPGAVGLFADIDSPISLRFLGRFCSATAAAWLSERRLGSWLSANAHCGRRSAAELYRRLDGAPGGLLGEEGRAQGVVTEGLVRVILAVRQEIERLETRSAEALALHPDGPIFQSLPRSGTVRAAALLCEIGDAKARARGKTNPHAERILARAWCGVIWRCWQDRVPYDPERHGALQRLMAVEG